MAALGWLLNLGFAAGGTSDYTPDAFTFTDLTGQDLGTVVSSNTVTIAGIDTTVYGSFVQTGHLSGEYSKNGGAWTTLGAFSVVSGDTIQLRLTTSASQGTTHSIKVDIAGVTDTWDVTTATYWTGQSDDASVWSGQSDDSSTWTVQTDDASSWTEQ